jgi:hypothetical protein
LKLTNTRAEDVVEKGLLLVIPNEVRNLSGVETQKKERFLGTQRAEE